MLLNIKFYVIFKKKEKALYNSISDKELNKIQLYEYEIDGDKLSYCPVDKAEVILKNAIFIKLK